MKVWEIKLCMKTDSHKIFVKLWVTPSDHITLSIDTGANISVIENSVFRDQNSINKTDLLYFSGITNKQISLFRSILSRLLIHELYLLVVLNKNDFLFWKLENILHTERRLKLSNGEFEFFKNNISLSAESKEICQAEACINGETEVVNDNTSSKDVEVEISSRLLFNKKETGAQLVRIHDLFDQIDQVLSSAESLISGNAPDNSHLSQTEFTHEFFLHDSEFHNSDPLISNGNSFWRLIDDLGDKSLDANDGNYSSEGFDSLIAEFEFEVDDFSDVDFCFDDINNEIISKDVIVENNQNLNSSKSKLIDSEGTQISSEISQTEAANKQFLRIENDHKDVVNPIEPKGSQSELRVRIKPTFLKEIKNNSKEIEATLEKSKRGRSRKKKCHLKNVNQRERPKCGRVKRVFTPEEKARSVRSEELSLVEDETQGLRTNDANSCSDDKELLIPPLVEPKAFGKREKVVFNEINFHKKYICCFLYDDDLPFNVKLQNRMLRVISVKHSDFVHGRILLMLNCVVENISFDKLRKYISRRLIVYSYFADLSPKCEKPVIAVRFLIVYVLENGSCGIQLCKVKSRVVHPNNRLQFSKIVSQT